MKLLLPYIGLLKGREFEGRKCVIPRGEITPGGPFHERVLQLELDRTPPVSG